MFYLKILLHGTERMTASARHSQTPTCNHGQISVVRIHVKPSCQTSGKIRANAGHVARQNSCTMGAQPSPPLDVLQVDYRRCFLTC